MSRDPMRQARIRPTILNLPASRIRAVYNAGQGIEGLIPLWAGEGDEPTPAFIRDAAAAALAKGETYYTPNRGILPLREAIRAYLQRAYAVDVPMDRIVATASGMSALMITLQCLLEAGDSAAVIGPIWPNGCEAIRALGAQVHDVYLQQQEDGRWTLDLDRLFAACDDTTKLIMLNSPGNPTGWVASEAELKAILDFARARGLWILSDEVYGRIAYGAARVPGRSHAPSFYTLAEPDDAVIVINSFSKSWSMTGWRLGWVVTRPDLAEAIEKMTEFNVSCSNAFAQWGAVAALNEGDAYVDSLAERYGRAADLVYQALAPLPRVRLGRPEGAFYAFFALDGLKDSLRFCLDLLPKAKVGLAPGIAFGPAGEGRIRLCYAASLPKLSQALERLVPHLK